MQSDDFICRDCAMADQLARAQKAMSQSANIFIAGAPGTGKTAFARHIHAQSRGDGAFVPVYCAGGDTFAEDMSRHAADGNTVFLHDAAELSAQAQAELALALRADTGPHIIAATSRELAEAVSAGAFREDLYYRLAVVTLNVPSLAERPADIPALAAHFAERFAAAHGLPSRDLSQDALNKLAGHHWPGNVRELENVMQRAVLFAEGGTISARDINLAAAQASRDPLSAALVGRTVADVERDLIVQTLRHCGGNRTQAADILGISVRTLRNKIRQYQDEGTDVPAFSRAA